MFDMFETYETYGMFRLEKKSQSQKSSFFFSPNKQDTIAGSLLLPRLAESEF
jgi:hypothetical protein